MKRYSLVRATSFVMAAVLAVTLAGCGSPTPDPSTVKPVDPMAAQQAQPADGSGAAPAAPEVAGAEISTARNFYFVFDGSGSMDGAPPSNSGADRKFRTKIEGAKWAVHEFMKTVPADVNLGLFVFDSNGTREVLPLGANNRQQFLAEIDRISTGGGTPLGRSIHGGAGALVHQYRKQLGYGEFRLIVITDGESEDDINYGVSEAVKNSMPIYTIGFGIGQSHALRRFSVSYKNADSAAEIQQALKEATAEMDVFDPKVFQGQK
jgi:Ca-activated chloride channel homolog